MRDGSIPAGHTGFERLRERYRDRRQRRAWRRERRRGGLDAYDSANQAESQMYRGGFFTKR